MDVPPIIAPSILQTGLFGTASVQPVSFLFSPPATIATSNVDIVDISGLGQLLSASLLFESDIFNEAAASQDSFSTIAAVTQFVEAFNSFLQSDSLQSPSGGSIGNLFIQLLNTRAGANSVDGQSIIDSLAEAGINFQPPVSLNGASLLSIDFEALQAAFDADPSGTVALLGQTTRSIGQLATEFTSLFTQVSILAQDPQSLFNEATLDGLLAAADTTAEITAATTAELSAAATAVATAIATATELTAATPPATAAELAAAATAAATPPVTPAVTTAQQTAAILPARAAATAAAAAPAPAPAAAAAPTPATVTPPAFSPLAAPGLADTPTPTVLPITPAPPATAAVAAAPTPAAPAALPQDLINPIIDASDPAVAAAIAAYHVVDGIFDSSKPRVGTSPASFPGYSDIQAVVPVQRVKIDLHA